jgi:hypothetical protein
MKLRKENRNSLHVLAVEGPLSTRDCSVLLTGIRKLMESGGSWSVDLSQSEPEPDCEATLKSLLLDCAGHSTQEFWIIGSHPWSHAATIEELESLRTQPLLASARLESWFELRTKELRARTSVVVENIRTSASPEMLALRRENSRLKRRLARVEAETARIESNGDGRPRPSRDARSDELRERILTSLEHALFPRERA